MGAAMITIEGGDRMEKREASARKGVERGEAPSDEGVAMGARGCIC